MKLHWSPRSPFVRKVMIALHETRQLEDVELVRSVVAVHLPPNPDVLADNPLGKIPTLITDEGSALFDSRVICEFLDARAGGGILVSADPTARFAALRWQALADGATDILLAWRTELTRPTGPWVSITDSYQTKIRAVITRLEAESPALAAAPFGIGQISVLCLLGQLDFRWSDCDWRQHFPGLAACEQDWAARPSVQATPIVDDQDASPTTVAVTKGALSFITEIS